MGCETAGAWWDPERNSPATLKEQESLIASKDKGKQGERVAFFHVLLSGLPPEVQPTFGVGLPPSNNPAKKIPHLSAPQLLF